jgi:hypothetical protein
LFTTPMSSGGGAPRSTTLSAEVCAKENFYMSDPDHARMLLSMAGKDLGALRVMADSAVFADEVFGFHARKP